MVRVRLISLTYFPTLYLLTSVLFPVNTTPHLSPHIVFRYLFLSVITFCIEEFCLKTAGIGTMGASEDTKLHHHCTTDVMLQWLTVNHPSLKPWI